MGDDGSGREGKADASKKERANIRKKDLCRWKKKSSPHP